MQRLGLLEPRANLRSVAVSSSWVGWQATTQAGWDLGAFNVTTNERLKLASFAGAQAGVISPTPYPVINGELMAWAENDPGPAGRARLVVYNLKSRTQVNLATGILSAPVFAGANLIWGQCDSAGVNAFHAVKAITLEPVEVTDFPVPGPILYLAGSGRYFVWTSEDASVLHVKNFDSGGTAVFSASPDYLHQFQFPYVVGDYLV